jgi:class 3 adenylate cyclase/predicted ATPase
VFCPSCGAENAGTAKFCAQCGTGLARRGPACTAELAASARFCNQCGTAVGGIPAAAPRPAPRVAEPAGTAIERRHITVMFCDLVGSTQLSRILDPEDLRDIVHEYRDACAGAVSRYEGTVAQYQGDGILVYFGYPVAHEDDARRAVEAGLDVLRVVSELNERLRAERDVTLAVRVGVHTGLAVVGDVGGANRTERLAQGDTPNIGSRMQSLAEPNTMVVSEFTHRLVSGFFRTESLGKQPVKGVAELIEVFRVLAASGAHHRLEAAAPHRLTPYVGRERHLAALDEAWRAARDGAGRAVLLLGEPGMGKSRVIGVFRQRLGAERHGVIECFCSPYFKSSALYPFAEMLRAQLDLAAEDEPPRQLERLRGALAAHFGEATEAVPLIAQLVGIPPSAGYAPPGLHPLTQKQKTLEAMLAVLRVRAQRAPVLMVVEDLHWVDPTSLELLGALIEGIGQHRMLLVMTARPGFRTPWPPTERLTELSIGDLAPADIETMIFRLTGGRALPAQVLALLVAKSDGNPLYVEEMTRMVLESGILRETEGGYELTRALPDVVVPATLHDLLMARLDRMEPEAKRVVQLGATIGREFSLELMRAILPNEEDAIGRGLDQLLGAGLVHASGRGFAIKHALIQDAAYESLLRRTRQQYHEGIATALEGPFAAEAQGHPERVAQHWTRAGKPARAIPYWLKAGQTAVASSASEEAANHLRQGLELVATLPESPERDRMELDLLSTLGTALSMLKGWAAPEVQEAYARANVLSERVGPNPQLFWVLWGLWAFYLVRGDQRAGLEFAQRMASLARGQGDDGLEIEADFALGLSFYYLGDLPTARLHLERAVARYVPEKHHANAYLSCQDVGVTSRSVASMVLYLLGETDLALERSRDAIALAVRLKHPFSQAYALGCAAWLDCYRRDYAAMSARARETSELSQAQALGWWLIWGTIFAGRGLVEAGQAEAGAAQMAENLAIYRGIGTGMVVPFFLVQLAEACGRHGDYAAALGHLEEARRVIAASAEAFPAAEVDRVEAALRAQRAGPTPPVDEARAIQHLFRRAMETARSQGARLFELRAATGLARLLAASGDAQAARELLGPTLDRLALPGATRDLDEARALAASTGAPARPAAA